MLGIPAVIAGCKEIILCTLTGAFLGAVFAVFKLPVPAPPVFPALMGIVGIWIGAALVARFI
jgi:XapX domain-containing protein